jgi:hypothetical protein
LCAGLTQTAAAGFMAGLERAYGGAASTCATTVTSPAAKQQGTGKAGAKQLPVLQFAQQAEFLRLASTALSAVQVSRPAAAVCVLCGTTTSSCDEDAFSCWHSKPNSVLHVLLGHLRCSVKPSLEDRMSLKLYCAVHCLVSLLHVLCCRLPTRQELMLPAAPPCR